MRLRKIILGCGLLSLFFSVQAATTTKKVSGTAAEDLVQALKLVAGIKPQEIADRYHFDAESLYCHSSFATEDGLQSYDCTINSKTNIVDAPAKLLYDAMKRLKIYDDPGMSQTRLRADHVHCILDPSTRDRFHCQWQELTA